MIKSFKEFLNEGLSYSKLTRFGDGDFEMGGVEDIYKPVSEFLDSAKFILIDENGDEDEFEVYNRIKLFMEEGASRVSEKTFQSSVDDYVHIIFWEKFPQFGKMVSLSRGDNEAIAKSTKEFMFFLPLSFRPDKFMQSTEGSATGKQYGV